MTIGSLPLLLLFFQQFSLISPLANAIAIPIISFIITPLALLAIVLPSGWMSWLLQLDHALLSLLMEMLIRMAELPRVRTPGTASRGGLAGHARGRVALVAARRSGPRDWHRAATAGAPLPAGTSG